MCQNELIKEMVPKGHRIPVLGSIPAGVPVEAVENIIDWEDIPAEWMAGDRDYFALQVTGDSMYPEYIAGDTVIVRKQSSCDSSDDCVVLINGIDATLKRVYLSDDCIELDSVNKMYGKRRFTMDEIKSLPVTILGVVVELRRKKEIGGMTLADLKPKRGAGYFRKRGKDTYELEYRRNRKTIKAKDDREAEKALAKLIADVETGKFRKPTKMSLQQLAERFLRDNAELI